MAITKKEKTCPSGLRFTRDNGTRCFGGTHCADGTVVGQAPPAKENHANGEANEGCNTQHGGFTKNGACQHGYSFNREEGKRCNGGTHYRDSCDGLSQGAANEGDAASGAEAGKFRSKKSPETCKHGYSFNREEGRRCNGGSHYVDVPQDEKYVPKSSGNGGEGLSGKWWLKNEQQCKHGYRFDREDGTRCTGGTHHVGGEKYDPAIHGEQKPRTVPKPSECPDGYRFCRESGTRCQGGTHYRN